jgi:hypothetical protein
VRLEDAEEKLITHLIGGRESHARSSYGVLNSNLSAPGSRRRRGTNPADAALRRSGNRGRRH